MDNISGIAVIDKDKGYTSHDVVNVIRRLYKIRRVGHTGTLDPDATGVLPVCIGKATKVCDLLTVSDKCYRARIKLGIRTDTYDISGSVTEEHEVNVGEDELRSAAAKFTGEIMQLPPMYSAIKIGGKKLCDLARKGIEVERSPRAVTVYRADVSDFDGVSFTLDVSCSKGTYIRTLADDIGKSLGCGAVLTELRRTKSYMFDLSASYRLDDLKKMNDEELKSILIPVDSVFGNYRAITVNDTVRHRLTNGARAYIRADAGTYRVYDDRGEFLCIGEVFKNDVGKTNIKLVKAFF